MSVKIGARVLSTQDTGGVLSYGVYMGQSEGGEYHKINWDNWFYPLFGSDLHKEDEFEVI